VFHLVLGLVLGLVLPECQGVEPSKLGGLTRDFSLAGSV